MRGAAREYQQSQTWDEIFLEWFSCQPGVDLFGFERRVGGFRYHQFVSRFQAQSNRIYSSFGRSQDRLVAAIRCAGECIERRALSAYFANGHPTLPLDLHNSNGWAVQRSASTAAAAARREALERHLLLKSFLTSGWNGFELVERVSHPEMNLFFLRAQFQTEETAAGLVVAQSPLYAGVSIGQCAGPTYAVASFPFWESAVYEAVDRILTLGGDTIDLSLTQGSWILSRSKEILENPFDVSIFSKSTRITTETAPFVEVETFDLSSAHDTDFPLFAAFAKGADVIPLFPSVTLRSETRAYLQPILERNGLESHSTHKVHPIL